MTLLCMPVISHCVPVAGKNLGVQSMKTISVIVRVMDPCQVNINPKKGASK